MSEDRNIEAGSNELWVENELSCDLLNSDAGVDPGRLRGAALGFFDGVHRGHQELLNALLHHCRRMDYEPVVFSFYRMPEKEAFDSSERQYRGLIQTPDQRAAFLSSYGISRIYLQLFNERFKTLSAEEFLQKILYEQLGVRLIVSGEDFRFGKDRAGDAGFLRAWGREHGVEVVIVPSVISQSKPISSSRIKSAIISGDFRTVSRLLGHDYSMSGHVVHGNALGRTIGMPTANVAVPEGQLCPPYGVYITRTRIGDRFYPSISNIGIRPTVNKDDFKPLLETYILGISMNLYDQDIEVFFLDYMRPELTFPSFLSMTAKIQEDITFAGEWHRSQEELVKISCCREVPVYTLAARRFNTSILNIVFRDRLDPKRAAANSLAARILTTACSRYPTRASLQMATDELYGANLGYHITRQGDLQSVTFSAEGIRNALDGSKPFAGIAEILLDLLMNPLLDEDGLLSAELFVTEQKNLIAELRSRRQDRDWYALHTAMNHALKGTPQAISAHGRIEEIRKLTRRDVTEAWQYLLSTAQIEVFAAGDIDEELQNRLADFTAGLPESCGRLNLVPGASPAPFDLRLTKPVREYRDMEQARLVMLYRGLPPYNFNQQPLVSMLNSMLGGDVHSLLFNSVREENALAYHISSAPLKYLNCLVIQTGTGASELNSVKGLIRRALADLVSGENTARLFETSKRLLLSELRSISDNLSSMLYFHMDNLASGFRVSLAEAVEELEQITPRQIQDLAAALEEAFTYELLPEPGAGEDVEKDAEDVPMSWGTAAAAGHERRSR